MRDVWLLVFLMGALFLATLTLWIPSDWPVAAFEIVVFLIAAVAIFQDKQLTHSVAFPLIILASIVLWGLLQLLTNWTSDRFLTERATLQWMTWAAVYYLGVNTLKAEAPARFARTAIVWFAFAVSVVAVLQAYLTPGIVYGLFPTGYHDFVMGPIVYHTHFAAFIEIVLPISLYSALSEVKKSSLFLGVSAALMTAVVVSSSRGGLVIVSAEVVSILLLWQRRNMKGGRSIRALALSLAAITSVLILIVGYETTSNRFATEALTLGRIQFAKSTLHMIAAHPVVGWGLGCWPVVYPAFATFDAGAIVNQAHSDWLQWTAEGGLPVLLAMLALALWAIRPAIRSIWGIGLLAVLIHATFDYPFSRPAVGAWPILMLSMLAARESGRSFAGHDC